MAQPDKKKSAAHRMQVNTFCRGKPGSHSAFALCSTCIKRCAYAILFMTFATLASSVSAEDNNILILLSGNDDVYLDVATTITNSTIKMCRNWGLICQDANYEISQASSQAHDFAHQHNVIVTLGIKAAIYARKHLGDKLLFSALIPKNSRNQSDSADDNPNHYYLYLDQPLHRSMLLISALSDSFKNVGVMISSNDNTAENTLARSASRLGMSINLETIENSNQIGTSLNRLLRNSDILLAVPDTKIHNKSTVSNILISAYRKRIPMIGFSSAYVKAGALAAIYSSPEDIAYHVRDNIVKAYSGKKIEKREQYAEYFSILFNSEVARSLDFPAKSIYELEDKMIKRSIEGHD